MPRLGLAWAWGSVLMTRTNVTPACARARRTASLLRSSDTQPHERNTRSNTKGKTGQNKGCYQAHTARIAAGARSKRSTQRAQVGPICRATRVGTHCYTSGIVHVAARPCPCRLLSAY
eukprot:scaffold21863_cov112-Isochrysis_galbana.AAC.1